MLLSTNGLNELLENFSYRPSAVVSFLNPSSYNSLINVKFDFNSIDFWCFDSILITKFVRLTSPKSIIDRLSFDYTSICKIILQHPVLKNKKVLLIGGTEDEATLCEEVLSRNTVTTGLQIKVLNGFFGSEFSQIYLDEMASSDVIVFSMGVVLQEKLALRCKSIFPNSKLIFTSGAFVSQTTRRINYYPKYVDDLNLRWLYRAFSHSHVRRRLAFDYPTFFLKYSRSFYAFIRDEETY